MPFQICHPRFFFDFAYKDSGTTPQPWENSVTFLLFKDNTTHKFEISSVLVQWFWLLSGLCRVNVQWSSLWCLKHSGYEAKIKNVKRWKSMGTEPQYVLSGCRVYSMYTYRGLWGWTLPSCHCSEVRVLVAKPILVIAGFSLSLIFTS